MLSVTQKLPLITMLSQPCPRDRAGGFSLLEIAIVLVIIAVLTTIVAVPLATQVEQRRNEETQKLLDVARDALYGFAAANGRLPCPATAASAGQESFCPNASPAGCGIPQVIAPVHGRCVNAVGLLPAVTLGISPLDAAGYAQDAWADGSTSRRIAYAVSTYQNPANTYVLTAPDGIKTATMGTTATNNHLYVCSTGLTSAPPTTNCTAPGVTTLVDKAPVVLFSFGKNNATNSFDETNNQNGDKVFSSGIRTDTFDDLVTWLSMNTLFDRMVKAGKLP
jgi:prepilin-type N-terminal cleavage/methylation domain-containing protein